MNRRLLIVPAVGVFAVLAGRQFADQDVDIPPEPVFPTVVGAPSTQDWSQDDWVVNRSVDDPFEPSLGGVTSAARPGSDTVDR